MKVTCSICKDVFTLDSVVCAVECGHLFHEKCISKWCETSLTCPHCRFKLKEIPFRIKFEVKTNTDEKVCGSQYEQLTEDLRILREEERKLKQKYDQMVRKLTKLQEEAHEAEKKAKKLKYDVTVWKQEYNYSRRAHEMTCQLEMENNELETKISLFIRLKKLIHGTDDDINEVLRGVPITSKTIEELCKFVQAMKQKLKDNQDYYKKQNDELIRLTKALEKELMNAETKRKNVEVFEKSVQTDEVPISKRGKRKQKDD